MESAETKIFKCDFFTSTYISGLETLRNGNHLNDVVLNVHGRQFSCHKLVLAANSKFFLTMFTAPLKERNLKEIPIPPEIVPEAMETLLDYFYSGELALSQSNIESVFRATDYMRLDMLLEICGEYMKETLNVSNSVQRFVLAESIEYSSSCLEDLKKASSVLIVNEVEEISQREDFLSLSGEHISKILNYNNQPKMAESLYWVILKWVSHDEETRKHFLYDRIQTLPVEGFSNNFLASKMRNEELLRSDPKSVLWLLDVISRFAVTSLTLSQPSSFLFADRGSTIQKCFLVKKVDNPTPQAIQDRPKIDSISAVSYKKRIYLLCGEKTEKSYLLDASNESWVDCNLDLKFGRDSAGCVVLNDDLFVVGGRDWKKNVQLSSCMKFNFCSGQKQSLPAMSETRRIPGVVVHANSLYVAGGYDTSPSIEKYDAREGRWCTAGQSTTKLSFCSATTVADYLYCCSLYTGKVERFDFRTNRSQQICSLPSVSNSSTKFGWISSVENDLFSASDGQIYIYDGVADKWNEFCCATDMLRPIIVPWL